MRTSPFTTPERPFYVIAEASGNHSQDLQKAHALVDAAAEAGAQAVKFQTFTPEEIAADGVVIATGHNPEHDAWIRSLGVTTMRELFALGGLPRHWHTQLKRHANDLGIDFLSTPFSVNAARFLVEEIGVPALKIASGDLTFTPLLEYANGTSIPVILSTGGATAGEVATAVRHLGDAYAGKRLALLHCRSVYPCQEDGVNLRSIQWLAESFPLAIPGWSDHTLDAKTIPSLALALGAIVFEKHLTMNDAGVDAGHSLRPREFKSMIGVLHEMSSILGEPTKHPIMEEEHDRLWARRDPKDWLRPTAEARQGQWA